MHYPKIRIHNGPNSPTQKEVVEGSKAEYIMFTDAYDWVNTKIVEVLYNKSLENCTDNTRFNTYRDLSNLYLIK